MRTTKKANLSSKIGILEVLIYRPNTKNKGLQYFFVDIFSICNEESSEKMCFCFLGKLRSNDLDMHISIFFIFMMIAKYHTDDLIDSLWFVTNSDFYVIISEKYRIDTKYFSEFECKKYLKLSKGFGKLFSKISEEFFGLYSSICLTGSTYDIKRHGYAIIKMKQQVIFPFRNF